MQWTIAWPSFIDMTLRLDRIVTGGGDGGTTSLGDATRVRKDAPLVEAMGTLDELNASLGFLTRLHPGYEPLPKLQNILFDIGAYLCQPKREPDTQSLLRVTTWLEDEIQQLLSAQEPLDRFIVPGGSVGACWAHFARTVTRRENLRNRIRDALTGNIRRGAVNRLIKRVTLSIRLERA